MERARLSYARTHEISFSRDLDSLSGSSFDLVLSAGGLSRLAVEPTALARVVQACAEEALVIAVEPTPSLFHALVLELRDGEAGDQHEMRRGVEGWKSEFTRAGLARIDVRLIDTGADQAVLLTAETPARVEAVIQKSEVALILGGRDASGFTTKLRDAFKTHGTDCRLADAGRVPRTGKAETLIWLAGEFEGDGVAKVAAGCLALRELAMGLGHARAKVFVAVASTDRPVAEAVLSFVRTLANEFPALDFRRIELDDLNLRTAAQLASVVLSNSLETDIVIDDGRVRALRYGAPGAALSRLEASDNTSRRLEKSPEGGLDRLSWERVERIAPKATDVEVAATGLNFRDVMWALSILPDEMLEEGFAGPTL